MKLDKYTDRPNLLRVAVEISKCQNPDKVLEILKLVLESGVNNTANSK